MRTVPKWYTACEDTVLGIQLNDIQSNREILNEAADIWYTDWVESGSEDHGSCCLGKGIQTWVVGPRKRSAQPTNVVSCTWVQGNVAASTTVDNALEFLRDKLPEWEFTYYDGRMD